MNYGIFRIADIFCHSPVVFLLKAKRGMRLTHPVAACFTESAPAAGDNLVCDYTLPDLIPGDALSFCNDMSEKFMARDKGRPDPSGMSFVSPGGVPMVAF